MPAACACPCCAAGACWKSDPGALTRGILVGGILLAIALVVGGAIVCAGLAAVAFRMQEVLDEKLKAKAQL